MTEITDIECVDDTCPACGATVSVPKTGAWVECPRAPHCRGRLRWRKDEAEHHTRELADAERTHLLRLRGDMAELDRWVMEGLPGAGRVAKRIREELERLTGEGRAK